MLIEQLRGDNQVTKLLEKARVLGSLESIMQRTLIVEPDVLALLFI